MTSLTSGLPRRETWENWPKLRYAPLSLSRIRAVARLAVAQTPITDFDDITFLGVLPSTVRSLIGSCKARVCTLRPRRPLTPGICPRIGGIPRLYAP